MEIKNIFPIILGLLLFGGVATSETLDVSKLEAATAELVYHGSTGCTAIKIDSNRYLTARHCYRPDLTVKHGEWSTEVLGSMSSIDPKQDWMVLTTTDTDYTRPQYEIGCTEEIYRGLQVSYMGHPGDLRYSYREGVVSTLDPPVNAPTGVDLDYTIDGTVAGGMSGSGLISQDTGDIIGVVIEMGEGGQHTGIESIQNFGLCEALSKIVVQ